jgi:Notch-like protein
MKQCILAPSTYTSFTECNGYLSSCTVSDTGSGCIPIPLVCSAIKKKAGCSIKKVVNATTGAVTYPANSCGWNGT